MRLALSPAPRAYQHTSIPAYHVPQAYRQCESFRRLRGGVLVRARARRPGSPDPPRPRHPDPRAGCGGRRGVPGRSERIFGFLCVLPGERPIQMRLRASRAGVRVVGRVEAPRAPRRPYVRTGRATGGRSAVLALTVGRFTAPILNSHYTVHIMLGATLLKIKSLNLVTDTIH